MSKKYNSVISLCIAVKLLVLLVLFFRVAGVRINLSSSMPLGLYQRIAHSVIHRGDIVAVCLPKDIALAGKKRSYISQGSCPGHTMALLKTVVALPGDTVRLSSKSIQVNGVVYFAPQQQKDHQSKSLVLWVKNKTYRHIKTVWLFGSHDPIHSWDSRYFGGVPIKNIVGTYRKLWVF